jgi:hypothetical protein
MECSEILQKYLDTELQKILFAKTDRISNTIHKTYDELDLPSNVFKALG